MMAVAPARASSARVERGARCANARRGRRTIAAVSRYDAASRTRMTDRPDGSVMFEFDADPPKEAVTVDAVTVDATAATAASEAPVAASAASAAESAPVEPAGEEGSTPLSKMKKAELVALCEELGLDATGTVQALRGRLAPALRSKA